MFLSIVRALRPLAITWLAIIAAVPATPLLEASGPACPPATQPADEQRASDSESRRITLADVDALLRDAEQADREEFLRGTDREKWTPADLFKFASPDVVKITIQDEDGRDIGGGSGFTLGPGERPSWESEGLTVYTSLVVTNYHVIRIAVEAEVEFSNGERGIVEKAVAEDEVRDLAVLEVHSLHRPFYGLEFCEGPLPVIGTKVYAIGSPQGLKNTLSEGIVSGHRTRSVGEPWLQITAPISPGSSGGPLLTPTGEVIGVTTAILDEGQNLNFAVPAADVQSLLDAPRKERELWRGTSIDKEVQHAYGEAEFELQFAMLQVKWAQEGEEFPPDYLSVLQKRIRPDSQLTLLLEGCRQYSKEAYAGAVKTLTLATKAEPGEYAYLAFYVLAESKKGMGGEEEDLEDLVPLLLEAEKLNPDFAPSYSVLFFIYLKLRLYPEALVQAESVVRLVPRCYEGYQHRGRIWAELGRFAAFEKDFATAIELRPGYAPTHVAKADGYQALGKSTLAIETYQESIRLDPKNWSAYYNMANTYESMGKYDQAIAAVKRQLSLCLSDNYSSSSPAQNR